MMYKVIFVFFILKCLPHHALAQSATDDDGYFWNIQPASNAAVFSAKAYIRTGTGINYPAIDSLSAGTIIMVKEKTKTFLDLHDIHAPWIKISYIRSDVLHDGYIWLGAMSASYKISDGITFLYGIEKVVKDTEKGSDVFIQQQYSISLKALKNDSLIDSHEWKINGGEQASSGSMLLLGKTGLANLENVVRISFGGEACGIPNNFYYFGFNGHKLLSLPGKYTVGDAGVFYHSENLLFPNEPGGKSGKIIKIIEEEEVLEEGSSTVKEKVKHSSSRETYIWNGEKALRIMKAGK